MKIIKYLVAISGLSMGAAFAGLNDVSIILDNKTDQPMYKLVQESEAFRGELPGFAAPGQEITYPVTTAKQRVSVVGAAYTVGNLPYRDGVTPGCIFLLAMYNNKIVEYEAINLDGNRGHYDCRIETSGRYSVKLKAVKTG